MPKKKYLKELVYQTSQKLTIEQDRPKNTESKFSSDSFDILTIDHIFYFVISRYFSL